MSSKNRQDAQQWQIWPRREGLLSTGAQVDYQADPWDEGRAIISRCRLIHSPCSMVALQIRPLGYARRHSDAEQPEITNPAPVLDQAQSRSDEARGRQSTPFLFRFFSLNNSKATCSASQTASLTLHQPPTRPARAALPSGRLAAGVLSYRVAKRR